MKQWFLGLCMVLALMVSMPLFAVQAAQLWNSQTPKDNADKKTQRFTAPQSSSQGSGVLYNTRVPNSVTTAGVSMAASINAFTTIKMQKKLDSAHLSKIMDASAFKDRQADIESALQQDYQTRVNTAKHMIGVLKQDEIIQNQSEQNHQARVAQYYADKAAGIKKNKTEKYIPSNNTDGVATSALTDGKDTPVKSNETTTILKKQPRLFNIPTK